MGGILVLTNESAPHGLGAGPEGFEMAEFGEEIAAAGAGQRVAGRAAYEQALTCPAVRAEAAVGHVDVRVPLGMLHEPLAPFLAGADIQVPLIEDTPPRLARPRLAPVHLRDRATAAVDRDELLGLPLERGPHAGTGEAIEPPLGASA